MEDVWRVVLYRALAILGITIIVFYPPPFPLQTLSRLEPILLASLLAVWVFSYYLRATMARRARVIEGEPVLRRYLGHTRTADLARILILAGGLVFVWFAWSSQPVRIFNATVLGIVWGGVEVLNTLLRFRQPGLDRHVAAPRINEKAQILQNKDRL